MTILQEIQKWSAQLQSWQRDAIARLFAKGSRDQQDEEDIESAVLRTKLSRQLAARPVLLRNEDEVGVVLFSATSVSATPTADAGHASRATGRAQISAEVEVTPESVFALHKVRPYPELKEINLADLPLLNLKHLDDFKQRAPDFLLETWPDYLEDFAVSQERLRVALEQQNYEDLHRALHFLVGNSGNAGAFVMHQFLKCRVAPDVETGHWPREEKWLDTLADLRQRTDVHLRQYLAQITVPPVSASA